ncbi:Mu transposase C-terminal domain-containing protein [Kocuria sp.]|uniref:Mu transposase C-terminal domain-containing protein n=1 Tax=Kocuria sp. TaxID=1871328 RepID=UPI0026DF7D97|nr:Mu transposase C-terminal domain-containing protein [Kocuria sp.]MDO5619654.1 Mu transposase C-terminal domain-containing protein [Kocuria sp.]
MKSVRLWDFIQFDGDSWQVVAQEGPTLALKSLTTNRIRKVAVSVLLDDESYLPDSPMMLPDMAGLSVYETLDPSAAARVRFLHTHVHEVLYGKPPSDPDIPDAADDDPNSVSADAQAPRPEYDSSVPFMERVHAKVAELAAAGTPMTERTLRRHTYAYRDKGVAGLVDGRSTKPTGTTGRVDPRVVSLIEAELRGQTDQSTGTRSRVINNVTREATLQGLPIPSRATMYRAIGVLEGNRHPFGDATTRRSLGNRPDRTFGGRTPSRPGELMEIDSTPLDLMVVYPDGTTGRPDLTILFDIATRTLSATMLRADATKSVDVAAFLLAKALTPLPMQPGWDASMTFSRSILPPGVLMDADDLADKIAARPIIQPESITIDRGKVYVGQTFTAACQRLQISVIKSAPRTPTDKPHIERLFSAVNTLFVQYLSGYTGRSVTRRGKDPSTEAVWTLQEVQNLLDQWVVAEWQNRPHPGLRHPAMPRKDLTPNEMYAALAGVAPPVHVTFEAADYLELLPITWRGVQPYGINFAGLRYDSPDLHHLRGRPSGLKGNANGRWEIRYDPGRLNNIWVRDRIAGTWIEVPWTLAKQAPPFSYDVLKAAQAALDRRDENNPVKVLEGIYRIQTRDAGLTAKERRAARRSALAEPLIPDTPPPAPTTVETDNTDPAPPPEPEPPKQGPDEQTRPRRTRRLN